MKFGKDMIKKIENIELVLENGERYDIPAKDVIDFWTSEVKRKTEQSSQGQVGDMMDFGASEVKSGTWEYNEVDDGGIIISKNAFRYLSSMAKASYADGMTALDYEPEEIFYLSNRVLDCCDLCQIEVKFKDGRKFPFVVPYDPLISDLRGSEIDLSNCPSAELDENGDMLILFGKSSHAYKRVDNNYLDLIIGLRGIIKRPLDEMIVKIEKFSNIDCDFRCRRLFIDFELKNHGYSGKKFELVFEDVRKMDLEISFDDEERSVWMSRVSTGEIYVEIENFCSFGCHAIKTYAAYIGKEDNNFDCENKEIYKKALNCELSEREMELFAANHFDYCENEFDLAAFVSAKKKVLSGAISVKYFKFWLASFSEMVQFYRGVHFRQDDFYNNLAIMMDELQIKLSYFTELSDCRQLIETSAEAIEKYYSENF